MNRRDVQKKKVLMCVCLYVCVCLGMLLGSSMISRKSV